MAFELFHNYYGRSVRSIAAFPVITRTCTFGLLEAYHYSVALAEEESWFGQLAQWDMVMVGGTPSSDYHSSRDVHGLALRSHSHRRPFSRPAVVRFRGQTLVNAGVEYSGSAR